MIKKLFAQEFHHALKNRRTAIAFLVGMGISIVHVFHNIVPYVNTWHYMAQHQKSEMQYPYHLFYEWICGNSYNLEGFLYFMIFPLLAVMPHSISFFEDKENGYVRQIYMRAERTAYLKAKFGAVFLAGGIIVTVPLLLNFLACAALLPALYPQNLAGTFINTSVLWYQTYECHPVLYVLLFLVIDFIFAGLDACLPLFFSFYSDKKYVILLMPFIMHIFIYAVCMMSGIPDAVRYAPAYLIFAGTGCPSGWCLAAYIVIFFLVGGAAYWKIGKIEDIF